MTDHYSGNDPETGCGLTLLGLFVAAILFWVILGLAIFDLGPFA